MYNFQYVYILAGTHKGKTRYKIGKAKNVTDRVRLFNVKIPFDIDLLFTFCVKDALALESKMHKAFRKNRLSGEWFNLYVDDMIKALG